MQDDVAGCFEYYAELAEKQDKQLETPVELPMAEFTSVIRHEPLGPIALISSFNYPMLIATVGVAALILPYGIPFFWFAGQGKVKVKQIGSPVHEAPAQIWDSSC